MGEVVPGRDRHGHRQGARLAHGGEQGRRQQLVFDRTPLPAAFDPDVAGPQPVTQREEGGGLPGAAMLDLALPFAAQDRVAPSRSEEAGRQALRPCPTAAGIAVPQRLGCPQRGCAGRDGTESEGGEEDRAEPMQHRPGPARQRVQIRLLRAGQPLGLDDAGGQPVPAHGRRHGFVEVGLLLLRRDQGGAQPDQQAHLVADGLGIAQDGTLLARLGTPDHAADRAIEQADGVIGQACHGIQDGRHQRRPAARQR